MALLALVFVQQPLGAQQTSSALAGTVTNASGQAVAGAAIQLTHLPTNSRTNSVADEQGRFSLPGLRPGGPYRLNVSAPTYQPTEIRGLVLNLNESLSLAVALNAGDTIEMDAFVVEADDAGAIATGSGVLSEFGSKALAGMPAAGRDPKEIARMDPRATFLDGGGGQMSIAGVNQRHNSITIDGIRLNDDFGLNRTGNPGRANPVSIDAIDQIVVKTSDYDVEASQYLGGNINIVTKSGSNEFHGSAYGFIKSDKLAGDLPSGAEPVLEDEIYGFTLGGPILKDRLFFFANYEKFTTSTPVNFTPADAGITDAEISRYQSILQDVYGYDPGGVQLSNPTDDERLLLKFDANLSEGHRAVFTYTNDEAFTSDQQESNTGNFALSSTYLSRIREVDGYSAQFFSDWTNRISTELSYSYKKAVEDRNPTNSEFAQFMVRTDSGSFLHAGPRFPFQQNFQFNIFETLKGKIIYDLGRHTLKAGYEYQKTQVNNDFILFAPNGNYVFDSFEDLENRTASGFMYENAPSGDPDDGGARWDYAVHNFFLQDEWELNDRLTFEFGVRAEEYSSDSVPVVNPGFLDRNGFSNAANLDGKSIVMPRAGFTWQPTKRTTVRAGFGLFSGGTPNVFYSNTYNRNGVATATVGVFRQPLANLSPADAAAIGTNIDGFNVAPEAQALVAANVGSGTAEALDPDFNIPSSWKASIGVEHSLDLSDFGLGDRWYLKADLLHIAAKDALTINVLGLTQTGTVFDGRPTFSVGTRDFLLTNTSAGESTSLSLGFEKSFESGWDVFGSWTLTDSEDSDSTQGSVLADTTRLTGTDINNLPLTTSALEIRHRFVLGFNFTRNFFDDYATRVGLFAEHRSGLPFSYSFANNPFNSQTTAPFYLPLADDPRVSYAEGTKAALDTFVARNGLAKYRGTILPRNGFRSDNVTKVDLRFTQEIPAFLKGTRAELIFDIDNLTNLLNSDWGIERSVSSNGTFGPSAVPLATVSYDAATDTYTYSGTPGAPADDDARIVDSISFWSIQAGIRISF